MSHCDWFTLHVGAWSGVSAGEVVEEVADVVGEIAEVPDAGMVSSLA